MPEPAELWLVRHGQSQGNVIRERPRADQQETLDIADRDMDVPLSELGVEQATALGRWLAGQSAVPDVVVASPYVRAAQTAQGICTAAGLGLKVHLDERLRERELGILDLLTGRGCASPVKRGAASGSASSTIGRPAGRAGSTWRCGCVRCVTRSPANTKASG